MVRRLLLGGFLGALFGGGLGAGYATLARVPMTPNASLLMAIAVGVLVAGLVRRPPWDQRSAIETVLRALLGGLLGAGLSFLAVRSVDFELPFAVPPMRDGTRFTEHAWLFPLVLGFVVGALVRAFGPDESPKKPAPGKPAAPPPAPAAASMEKTVA